MLEIGTKAAGICAAGPKRRYTDFRRVFRQENYIIFLS